MNKKVLLGLFLGMFLISLTSFSTAFSGSGSGTSDNPFQITSWSELNETRDNLTASYILMNDLSSSDNGYNEIASQNANDGNGWIPIGYDSEYGGTTNNFQGNFYGNNHIIKNLYINLSIDEYKYAIGLFGATKNTNISNLGLYNTTIHGNNMLKYANYGTLVGSANSNTIIKNCYSNVGILDSLNNNGGLVGIALNNNFSKDIVIENCWTNVTLMNSPTAGGIVGEVIKLDKMIIKNCYSIGELINISIFPSGIVAGIENYNSNKIYNSYFNINSMNTDYSYGGEGKTTEQMKNISTYINWSISDSNYSNIWYINNTNSYPILSWQIDTESPIISNLKKYFNNSEIIYLPELYSDNKNNNLDNETRKTYYACVFGFDNDLEVYEINNSEKCAYINEVNLSEFEFGKHIFYSSINYVVREYNSESGWFTSENETEKELIYEFNIINPEEQTQEDSSSGSVSIPEDDFDVTSWFEGLLNKIRNFLSKIWDLI